MSSSGVPLLGPLRQFITDLSGSTACFFDEPRVADLPRPGPIIGEVMVGEMGDSAG